MRWKTARLVVAAVTLVAVAGCTGSSSLSEDAQLSADLERAAQRAATEAEVLDLDAAATHDWERVAVVEPYTEPEDVVRLVGADVPEAAVDRATISDSDTVLIFTIGDEVTGWATVPRTIDLAPVAGRTYLRHEATFELHAVDGDDHYEAVHVQP